MSKAGTAESKTLIAKDSQAMIILREDGHLTRQQIQDLLPRGMPLKKLVAAMKMSMNGEYHEGEDDN